MRKSLVMCLFLSFSGCAAMTATNTPTSSSTALVVPVSQEPPATRTESKTASPGFGYIWAPGYYEYMDGAYVWHEGRWAAQKPHYEYVAAFYEKQGDQWYFHRPHWKKVAETATR